MWTSSILSEICRVAGWRYGVFWYSSRCGGSLPRFTEQHSDVDIMIVHDAQPDQVMELGRVRGVHITRDPRDVIISGYRSHKGSHWFPEGTEERDHQLRLRELNEHEGILLEIEFSRRYLEPVAGWMDEVDQPDVLEMSFERLTAQPYTSFLDIIGATGRLFKTRGTRHFLVSSVHSALNRVGLKVGLRLPMKKVPGEQVLAAAYRLRYEENEHHHGGVREQWKERFTAEHFRMYYQTYGDLAERMGYEPPDLPNFSKPSI